METAALYRRFRGSLILDLCAIAAALLVAYAALMYRYPIVYGGDTVIRLVNFPGIVYGHQLPLLEILIYCVLRIFYAAGSIFMLMAVISAVACAGIYMLATELTGDRVAGCLAALLYATHPFILYYSRVPYQEPLLFAAVAWSFYFLFRSVSTSNLAVASLLVGAACLSRYEGWIAALTAAGFDLWRRSRTEGRFRPGSVVKSMLVFGWAPALWIAWNAGLSPAGTYVVDLQFGLAKLYRVYFVAKSALWWSESAVVMLAMAGLLDSFRTMRRDPRFHALLAMLTLYMGALIVSGHGIDPDPVRIVTEREAFVPIGLLVLYAAIGGRMLIRAVAGIQPHRVAYGPIAAAVLLSAAVGYSVHRGLNRIAAANEDPDLKTNYQVACFLAGSEGAGLVLAAPLPVHAIQEYLRSAEKWGGPRGRDQAAHLLEHSETTPLDYQRVLAYSWVGRHRLYSAERIGALNPSGLEHFLSENGIEHIVVFSDFVPDRPHEKLILERYALQRVPEFHVRNGNKAVSVYPVRHENAGKLRTRREK